MDGSIRRTDILSTVRTARTYVRTGCDGTYVSTDECDSAPKHDRTYGRGVCWYVRTCKCKKCERTKEIGGSGRVRSRPYVHQRGLEVRDRVEKEN